MTDVQEQTGVDMIQIVEKRDTFGDGGVLRGEVIQRHPYVRAFVVPCQLVVASGQRRCRSQGMAAPDRASDLHHPVDLTLAPIDAPDATRFQLDPVKVGLVGVKGNDLDAA